ncbi:LysR family transcriptional regulator [Bdellovibrio bacteriovorus]|uniref:LysR family transcriptional regulator n=1 Tax=Bdellovibrio bacteriovorus TaxID=959 RepID=A0A150WKV9_BDEBC|nr:LysR family transcriptional regulator [Bdellovibrio bacteriovorus]KYG64631.1 LysR family transcriptional regulator [Bdellovibrio bacteriovorus]
MKNLYQLTTFVTVISEGSMTAAADKLYLTQPAVSQQIRNLEEDLGVELLVRGVRQIKATPQGEVLYEYAKKIINLTQQAEIAIKSIGAHMKGQLRIGTLNSLGLHLMSPIVGRLMRHNPDLMLKVDYDRGEELIKSYKKGLYDILILPDVKTEFSSELENSEQKFVAKEEMWLVGSSKDEKMPQQISFKDIGAFPLVNFTEEFPGFNNTVNSKMQNAGLNLSSIFESANVGTLKRVIEAGLGWGFLPAHSIKKQVRSGRLNRVYVKDLHYEIDLMFYYKKNSENKALVEVFYQTMSQQEKG